MKLYKKIIFSKPSLIAWLILFMGLGATYLFSQYLEKNLRTEEANQFALNCDRITSKVKERFNVHVLIVLNTVARVRSSETIDRQSFKKYIDDIQINQFTPGIYGVGLNTVVQKDDLEKFEKKVRAMDFPDFKVRPVGERNLLTPVTYLEPLNDVNLKAIGYDTYSNPTRRAAQNLAMDSGNFAITKKIELVQDNGTKKAGIILFAPVYKNNVPTNTIEERRSAIKAFISSPFQMDQMMLGILSEEELKIKDNLVFRIFDSSDSASKQILFTNENVIVNDLTQNHSKNLGLKETRFIQQDSLNQWQIEFNYVADDSPLLITETLISLIFGSLLSVIAFLYVLSKIHLKEDVKLLAASLTEKNTRLNQRLTLALGAADMGVWDYDPINNILIWDKKQFDIFGFEEQQFEGLISVWENAIHPEDKESTKNTLQEAISNAKDFNAEFRIFKFGEIRYIKGQGTVVKNENQQVIRVIGVNYDVTELRNSQNLLEQQKVKAEIANIAKSNFIAKMSHEIRTPMSGIIGLTSMALRLQMPSEIRDYFSKITLSANSLLKIVNDILDFSKVEAGRFHLQHEPFNLYKIFDEAKNLFSPIADIKNISLIFNLDPQIPPHLIGDETRLRQVLLNIIGNAIKFTHLGTIEVSTKLQQIKNRQAFITFSVKDTGIGVDDKDIEKILRPFEQADDSVSRKFGGTGLGLTISQELLKLMHSSLYIESKIGVGSLFSFDLILDINANQDAIYLSIHDEALPEKDDSALNKFSSKTILIVEDNPINAAIFTQMLNHLNINVLKASSGQECIDMVKNKDCDLILMDIQIPGINGLEASKIIRTHSQFNHIPIIGISAGLSSMNIADYLDHGMQGKLDKPFTIKELSDCIDKFLV